MFFLLLIIDTNKKLKKNEYEKAIIFINCRSIGIVLMRQKLSKVGQATSGEIHERGENYSQPIKRLNGEGTLYCLC